MLRQFQFTNTGNGDNKYYQFQMYAILNDNRGHQWPCTPRCAVQGSTAHHCSALLSCTMSPAWDSTTCTSTGETRHGPQADHTHALHSRSPPTKPPAQWGDLEWGWWSHKIGRWDRGGVCSKVIFSRNQLLPPHLALLFLNKSQKP